MTPRIGLFIIRQVIHLQDLIYLTINLQTLKPEHFKGIILFTEAQEQAIRIYFREFGKDWISAIIQEQPTKDH